MTIDAASGDILAAGHADDGASFFARLNRSLTAPALPVFLGVSGRRPRSLRDRGRPGERHLSAPGGRRIRRAYAAAVPSLSPAAPGHQRRCGRAGRPYPDRLEAVHVLRRYR
jgi:hypothetical protein